MSVSCTAGVAIDGNNNEDKERFIKLVKKRGKVKALEEELYSKCLKNYPFALASQSDIICISAENRTYSHNFVPEITTLCNPMAVKFFVPPKSALEKQADL